MRSSSFLFLAGTMLMTIAVVLVLAGCVAGQTDPPASGDWTVADTTLVKDRTVDLTGDLRVTGSGSLTLQNVTLRIHVASAGQHGIEVDSGGSLTIEDGDGQASTTGDGSRVTAEPTSLSYYFINYPGSTLRITNSFITRCGHAGMAGSYRLGLYIGTDDAVISGTSVDDNHHGIVLEGATATIVDSQVRNCTYHGIQATDSDLTVDGTVLADNGYEGIRIVRGDGTVDGCQVLNNRNGIVVRTGANVTISNTVIKGNEEGVVLQSQPVVTIDGCTIRAQSRYGVHLDTLGSITVIDSTIAGSSRDGLFANNGGTVVSQGTTYANNVYGVRLNMNCAMTSSVDTFSSNTNSGIYLESTSDLVMVGGTVRGNSAGVKAEGGSKVTTWDTTVEECAFEGYSVTDSDLVVHDGQMLNCTGGGIVAPAPSTAQWAVHSGNSSRLVDSDLYLTEGLVISGDTVLHDSAVVFPDGSYPSYLGVSCDGGLHDWRSMTFRPETSAGAITFDIFGSASGSAWYVTVQKTAANNAPADSPIVNAAFEFHICTFKDSTNGLIVHSADVVLDRCTFTGNSNGASVSGVEVRFENCTFTANTAADVTPVNGGHAVLVNCSFDPSMVVPSGPSDRASIWWVVHVRTRFPSGTPVPGAVLTIKDAADALVYQNVADDHGFLGGVLLLQTTVTETGSDDRTPHTFNASSGISYNETTVTVDRHMTVTLTLQDGEPPTVELTSHADGEHIRDPYLVLEGTASDNGSGLYRVEVRISTQPWTQATGLETWQWSTSLPGDGTFPMSVRVRDLAFNEFVLYFNLTLDTKAPQLVLEVPPTPVNNSLVNTPTATFQGYVDKAETVVTVNDVEAEMNGTSFTVTIDLLDGLNIIKIRVVDRAGNAFVLEWRLEADLEAPLLTVNSPHNGSTFNSTSLILEGETNPFVDAYYRVLEVDSTWRLMTVTATGRFSERVSGLVQGENHLEVMVRDSADNTAQVALVVIVDTISPTLLTLSPENGEYVRSPWLNMTGSFSEPLASLSIDSHTAAINGSNFSIDVPLLNGLNFITLTAKDLVGNLGIVNLRYFLDTIPPMLDVPSLDWNESAGAFEVEHTNQRFYQLVGTTELGSTVWIDLFQIEVDNEGAFVAPLNLTEGENEVEAMVRDPAGNEFSTTIVFILDSFPPELTVESPKDLTRTEKDFVWVRGTVTQGDTVSIGALRFVSKTGTFELKVPLEETVNRIVVTASDEAGNEVSIERVVFMGRDTSGITGHAFLDDNCTSLIVVCMIAVVAIGILLSYLWKGTDVQDRRERALQQVFEEDHIELDKPVMERTGGYLAYDPTSETGRRTEFEEREDEDFISMEDFKRSMEGRDGT